ncbi:uncharacterized protein METZ01_LOCUS234506 [marine metagenome]|uniref:DUF418 domain-containing protein n=1 Tax=marine metagenome TaxID=408172 RepID=A0A382H3A8_9ZZZZ|tara:strand:- start:101 stop:1345 length:1245 start_codon:yes stop_codon:yes gene_type:complete
MKERITSIDVLRGFALLGILIMNIMSFAMPSISYFSPLAYNGTIPNQIIYCISHIIADQKFMAIFSMLFGASTLLFMHSVIKKGKRPSLLYYSRNFWLLLIGWMHSYFVWYGDILLIYALCSFLLYFLRNISPRKQFVLGFIIYLIPSFSNYLSYKYVIDYLEQADQNVIIEYWNPNDETIQKELDAYRGSYKKQVQYRAQMWSSNNENDDSSGDIGGGIIGLSFLIDFFSRAFGMMLIGMSCFTWGVFSNSLKESFYKKMMQYGFGIGLPLSILGLGLAYSFDWDWKYVQFLGRIPNTIATPFTSFGYIGMTMLWIRKDYFKSFQDRLRAIGKTALTSYLFQSIIATFIFYGFGLGLFGHVNRFGQIAIMFFIWGLLLIFCSGWLKRFQYGPVEWIWRMLTYMKLIPILKQTK